MAVGGGVTSARNPTERDLFATGPRWRFDGDVCAECHRGPVRVRVLGPVCECEARGRTDRLCRCVAEGYAACDACGMPVQVWPADVVEA